ncbi:CubicO group peptidase (beta-lactamase class C family) [Kutzneria kofuensis]|uniref:CubicO group peptidase (Beta-lactamase class C family) n=2 Tax=Kutzneria kofuensis TaxID=103725 RepID=A0A7W9KNH4_9PSEU|nr:CubicO group peptidase (beta-lactamase class C family) [Kutzneria kofuensis]
MQRMEHWQSRLDELARRHGVPGAVLGISSPGWSGVAATGVCNSRTGAAVRPDSVFHLGSITKVFLTTAIMRLVQDGRLDLDKPVSAVLPELALGDAEVTDRVSLRHLLTHTSGIDGDVFVDTGRGDDCIARYVAQLADVAQNSPLGATWSYCNSGFSLAGRVVEQVTGQVWDAAMKDLVFDPLGLADTLTLPEDALLRSTAVGHTVEDGRTIPVRQWQLPRSIGPAGLIASTVSDLLTFARLHLDGGGELLTTSSVEQMQAEQVRVDAKYSLADTWGLGWMRLAWDGQTLIGHDGSTIGQQSHLVMLPSQGLAVALLTNRRTPHLYEDLFREIFAELAGVEMARQPVPPAEPLGLLPTDYVGVYERAGQRTEVVIDDGKPVLRVTTLGKLAEYVSDPVEELPMVAFEPDVYLVPLTGSDHWLPVSFYTLADGSPYLHFCGRASARRL